MLNCFNFRKASDSWNSFVVSNQENYIVMKKLVLLLVLVVSVMAVKAQDNKSPNANESKSTVTSPATSIKVADLPKSIADNIAKDYPGYSVKEASTVTGKKGLNYQVVIAKGSETEALLYDKDGSFIQRLDGKPGMHDKAHDKTHDKAPADSKNY
jgi:hypothetical protein